jgi:diguanylate cyclase
VLDRKEKQALDALAGEVLGALAEAGRKKGGLSVASFSQVLAERAAILDMIQTVCHGPGMETVKDDKEISYEKLKQKYQEIGEELRHADSRLKEMEESFRQLASTLATIASNPDHPDLDRELKSLRQMLRQKVVPSRLDAASKTLKNFIIRGDDDDSGEAAAPSAAPEGVEENLRDILVLMVQDIAILEDEETQKRSKLLIRRIQNEFTLDDFEPFVHDIHDLIFHLKDQIRQEKRKLFGFSQEIISRLEDTEKELLRNLDSTSVRLGPTEDEFEREVATDIRAIERTFDEGLSVEQVRTVVIDKIQSIRRRFKAKRAEDQTTLERLVEEKAGVERRLQDIHQRYQDFAQKSQTLTEEMERFRQASLQDGLTGVLNRRAYDLHIRKAIEETRAGRLGRFGLVVFDIDHFKNFNNSYGHRAGDKTLIYVSRFTRQHMRKEDLLFRYGGDEFALILPEADLKASYKVANKIRTSIYSVEFKIFKESDLTVRVGLSMGVAQSRPDDDPAALFNRADKALYLAKEKGRNQVITEAQARL